MSKNDKYKNRLDDLFSAEELPDSEPLEGQQVLEQAAETDLDEKEMIPGADPPFKETSQTREVKPVGWDDYFNAIDRDERLGFSFEQEAYQLLKEQENNENVSEKSDPEGVIEAPLQIGDTILGVQDGGSCSAHLRHGLKLLGPFIQLLAAEFSLIQQSQVLDMQTQAFSDRRHQGLNRFLVAVWIRDHKLTDIFIAYG